MDKKTQEAVSRLQVFEQNLQQLGVQKQQVVSQLFEVENALRELEGVSEAFKIVGGIMVKSDAKVLSGELRDKQERLKVHVSSLERQEKQWSDQAVKIRTEVMGKLKVD